MEKIKRILDFLSKIPNDKLLHSFYGTLVFVVSYYIFYIEIALAIVIVVAFVKEVLDIWLSKFCYKDFIYTIIFPCLIYGAHYAR